MTERMARIRVLVGGGPQILRDIVGRTVAGQPDMQVVDTVTSPTTLLERLARNPVDIVILGLGDCELPEALRGVFDRHPLVRVLGVAQDGRNACMYELRPHRQPLGALSPEQLVDVIRSTAATTAIGRRQGAWE